MKNAMKDNLQKAGSAVGNAAGKSAEAVKFAATGVKSAATGLAAKIKEDNLKAKLKKLNPLFPDEYLSPAFHIPNLVVIVDDAVRRGEALCEGAIGWRSTVKEVEVLYLYDEFIPESGLSFVPVATCDNVYFVDPHNRSRFIQVDCLFDRTQKDKLAELANVAYCLGAKRYSVEMVEQKSKKSAAFYSVNVMMKGDGKVSNSDDRQLQTASGSMSKTLANVTFEEARNPVEPKLCWFRHDNYLQEIIRQRCSGESTMRNVDLEFSGSDYATMSASTSVKVDAAVGKIGLTSSAHIEASSSEERSHKMIFHLEF